MPIANWKTQTFNVIQSLLFNNPDRVIEYSVRDEDGNWKNRANDPAPVVRLYEYEADEERTCLQTIQFVHHMLIPPGERHVKELHIHPDAEEIVVITKGRGEALIGSVVKEVQQEDVVYVAPNTEHEFRNTGDKMLGVLFICVPTGEGLTKLTKARNET